MILKIKGADSLPVKMNGEYIFREDELARPEREQMNKTHKAIQQYVVQRLKPVMEKLGDGVYISNANNLILDENGRLVYFDRPFVMRNDRPQLDDSQFAQLFTTIKDALNNAPNFEPITRGGKPVLFNIENLFSIPDLLTVKDQKLQK